ncbi:MAG: transglutaminase domain-containing protein, partial [Bacteroidales bacterium]|nr:transglutaminase domain-containing protein [Bacteroidales bacterium]
LADNRQFELFEVFDQDLNAEEKESLEFLYAYMPLCDLADYDGEYYLNHVKTTLKAKEELPWGSLVPDSIFRHFVLPHRINNENLDDFRSLIYEELKERVQDKRTMYEAALEVNHWCHEKVEYHSADSRTSSPLATLKTGFGRCGEESTFTVASLRTVGIPARQVYTPRWAHSDDNHAWVEVWADGEWFFLGACEPEPVLNTGWFAKPATRTMLVHTKVYGDYDDANEVNVKTSQFIDINVINRYANTCKQYISVLDGEGAAVPNAIVEYQLYNYAEFYPLTAKLTDANGLSFVTTGLGELLVWVRDKERYGYKRVLVGEQDTAVIVMNNPKFEASHWELMPPSVSDKLEVNIKQDLLDKNKISLQKEDSIREIYVSSFVSKESFLKSYNADLWTYVKASRGNHQEIMNFIEANKDSEWLKPMLELISEKDLRDTKADILNDHLTYATEYVGDYSNMIFMNFILNPRVELEMLKPFREIFHDSFSELFIESAQSDPNEIIDWIADNIELDNSRQSYDLPITPLGVHDLRVSDERSVNIFFVALCRSFGIPARLEIGTYIPQYFQDDVWIDVFLDDERASFEKFDISFNVVDKDLKFTPQYYHHFSLAVFENNRFNTIRLGEYQDVDKIIDLKLGAGYYRLITSNRLSSGRILVDMVYFNIDSDIVIDLEFPKNNTNSELQGQLNRKKLTEFLGYIDMEAKKLQESLDIVLLIIQPDKEPTKHILNDIQKIQENFNKLNNTIVFLIPEKDMSATFKIENYPNLPMKSIFKTIKASPMALLDIQIDSDVNAYPKVMIVNKKGDIFYFVEGYKIGVGDDILKNL